MKITFISFLLLALLILPASAQKEVTLKKITLHKAVAVNPPLMIDSVNLKGEKFQNKDFLETFISMPDLDTAKEELIADSFDYIYLTKPQQGAMFYILSFRFSADRFAKTKIKIIAPSMYELYIDGKKETSKTTIEDSISTAKVGNISMTTEPGTHQILIKYMSLATNVSPEGMKITISPEDKDADINYTVLSSAQKRDITINDIIVGKRVTSSSISPNGQYVLLNYTTTKDDGKTYNEKELFTAKTNRRIVLQPDKSYEWMPVSNKLYYKNEADKNINIIAIDPETLSESVYASNIPTGDFIFSPNEKALIYTDREEDKEKKGDLIRLQSPEDRQNGYRDRYFLSKYDLLTGVKQRLTFGKQSTFLSDINRDGTRILFLTKEEVTQQPFSLTSMFCLNLQTLSVDTLWMKDGFANTAKFSPDGKNLLIEGSADAFGGIAKNIKDGETANAFDIQAYIMNLENKKIEPITKDFTPSVNSSVWNRTDGMIYLETVDRSYVKIYRYNPKTKKFIALPLSEDVVRNYSIADNSPFASYTGVSISNSTRAYVLDLNTDKSTLITDPRKDRLSQINLGKTEDWVFKSTDGTPIDGCYYLPPSFNASKKYPLIVYYYGGTLPTPRSLEGPYPPHVYAALGYVVYVIQPSGTIGYGQEFASRHVNAWGKYTADDIITGTKQFVAEHPYVDEKKIGCIGASYGGFMTMYLQTQTDMFAAAVSHAGISALSSYWGEGYWGYTYSTVASANSYPWNNKPLYVDQSPLFNADKIKTPLLLLHGTDDTNVPIGESIQMYTALKILGKPVEFIQVKGENHGIRDFKKRIEWNNSIYAWFAKWLQDDPTWWNSLYPN
ncbi:MAG: prolyl oligopeptidase family serine peptidase [Dysgonomonas sp.]